MDEDLGELMDSILWGYRIVEIRDKTFAFRPLSLEEKNIATYVRNQALRHAAENGRLTEDQLYKDAIQAGIWSLLHDEHIAALRDELSRRKDDVLSTRQKSKIKKLNRRITKIKETLAELLKLRFHSIELPSAEFHASRKQLEYLVQVTTCEFPDLSPRWPTYADMEDERDLDLVVSLMNQYPDATMGDQKAIRRLARSGNWRLIWASARETNMDTLFRSGLDSLTYEQQVLINWSMVYDSVFDSHDRPPDYIIDDDDELDRWLKKRGEEADQERKKSFHQKKSNVGIGKQSKHDANEVMIPVDGFYLDTCDCGAIGQRGIPHKTSCPYGAFIAYKNNDRRLAEVDKVQSCNPDNVRMILAKEQASIEKQGWVAEQNLRGELSRKTLGLGTNIHKRDKR